MLQEAGSEETIKAGIMNHFTSVSVSFRPRKDFQYSWNQLDNNLSVTVSDYLVGAPQSVLFDFGDYIGRSVLLRTKMSFPKSFMDYISGDDFINIKRPDFLKRSRNLILSTKGNYYNIEDSLKRLYEPGLIGEYDLRNAYFSWCKKPTYNKLGVCFPMFRTVGISPVLDNPNVPEHVFDFVVYHECLHLRQGLRWGQRVHDVEFHRWEKEYPYYEEAHSFLPQLKSMV